MKMLAAHFIIFFLVAVLLLTTARPVKAVATPWWPVQAIDTMKYSRDMAREKVNDPAFDKVIDMQVKNIADTGATHVSIGTPYDEEFVPMLSRWVAAARRHHLKVWFRGNWSGWEGWFNYPIISRAQHLEKTEEFIATHPDLFEDGDIFTACPECENGEVGDPRFTGDIKGHRAFLIDLNALVRIQFQRLGKNVKINFNSMNGDVARAIMNPATTQSLGGVISVDHYVAKPQQLADDVSLYARNSEGLIILGEFGAPIPDIHGRMSDIEQALWLDEALGLLAPKPELIGINYWVNTGGSTALWDAAGNPRPAVQTLKKYFTPTVVTGKVVTPTGKAIDQATIKSKYRTIKTDQTGSFAIPVLSDESEIYVFMPGKHGIAVTKSTWESTPNLEVTLQPLVKPWWYSFQLWWYNLLESFSSGT